MASNKRKSKKAPLKFIDVYLDDAQIEQYKEGGYTVEPLEEPIKPNVQKDTWGRSLNDKWYGFDPETKKYTIAPYKIDELRKQTAGVSKYDALERVQPQVAESTKPDIAPVQKLNMQDAVNQKAAERDIITDKIKQLSLLTDEDKASILMDPRKVDEYNYLLQDYDPGTIKQSTPQSTAGRAWDIITNPFDAFEYAVRTGDVSNMPRNYNEMRMAGIDPSAGQGANAVGNTLNTFTNLFDAGDKVVRNVGEGNYGTAALEALRFLPGARVNTGAGKYLSQGYNKIATGNSRIPLAWKMEQISDITTPIKNKYNLTDDEAFVLGKYINTPYSIRRGTAESEIFDNLIKRNSAILDEINNPITKVLDHSTQSGKDIVPSTFGSTFTFPGNRSWSVGVDPRFTDTGRRRLVIPSKYSKELDFTAVPYDDTRLVKGWNASAHGNPLTKLDMSAEKELIGNIPEGYKVIGKSNEGGFENIFIKPNKVRQQLPGSPNALSSADDVGRGFKSENFSEKVATLKNKTNNSLENIDYELSTILKKINPIYQSKAKNELKEANQWQKDWYNHPASKKRTQDLSDEYNYDIKQKMYLHGEKNGLSKTEIDEIIANDPEKYFPKNNWDKLLERVDAENYLSQFQTKGSKINKILKGEKRLHKGNFGVSGHRLDKNYKGYRQNFVDKYSPKVKSTGIHEGNHGLTEGNYLIPHEEQKNIVKIFGDDAVIPQRNSNREFNSYEDYLKDPTEVYARIMELREFMGLAPNQVAEGNMFFNMIAKGRRGETPVDSDFFNLIQDTSKFKELFNRLPAIAPIAIGAGAATYLANPWNNQEGQQFQNGGYVDVELSDEDIARYKAAGFKIEDIT
jgi:hypothetical protein